MTPVSYGKLRARLTSNVILQTRREQKILMVEFIQFISDVDSFLFRLLFKLECSARHSDCNLT
jgi:hypothetical protein